jgi:serine/threonine protein kinase
MSPELFRHEPYGHPADWWALGIVIYMMIYVDSPFKIVNNTNMTVDE